MKTLNIILLAIGLLLMTASCSKEEPGIRYEILNPEVLQSQTGDTFTLELSFEDEDGISQIVIESKDLGIDELENLNNRPTNILRNISIVIPDDAEVDDLYTINLEVSDDKGYRIQDSFDIEVTN